MTILEEAVKLVYGERQEDYGDPAPIYSTVGRVWGALLGREDIPASTVLLMMAAMKLCREVHRPKRDNLVDMAGYTENVGRVRYERRGPDS